MAKLWTSLSLLLVVVMLLFLAPTLLLLPGQIVSAAGEEVTQEIEATFSFNETGLLGDWYSFTAGSGTIQPPGPCLAQYTRDNVIAYNGINQTVPDCQFRNYTTGSGGVAGDLAGTLSLAWNTVTFNYTYPYTPRYNATDPYFGWMAGRGHFYDGSNTNNNFTFVFVADFDCNTHNMTNAAGKGFMLSVNENGAFAGHKIIGDFEITKTGDSYTGSFHLRNYPPDEVYALGMLNVGGGVLQEFTDNITAGVSLVDFTQDGAISTPTDDITKFEEVAWGRDPIKNITSGHLGVGGEMDLSRNNILYLKQPVKNATQWVYIQGLPVCNLYINDTNAGTRAGDGSSYGKLYELLLLTIPYQELTVNMSVPNYFDQYGYTFTPFGMFNPSTECYAGTESFANAEIFIQAVVGTALQHSTDLSYGLYPHPRVTSITPNNGNSGQTMSVTIAGKYLLRAANFANNTGSVSFGLGVTVNSYSFKNSSPIDNEIIANITIGSVVSAGPRDVNVTSCFGYAGGHGAAPYESDVVVGGFTINGNTGTLNGHVDLKRKAPAGNFTWVTPLVVQFFDNSTKTLVLVKNVTTDAYGNFTLGDIGVGTWDVAVKNWTTLSRMAYSNVFTTGNNSISFGPQLAESDTDNDDQIKGADFNRVLVNFGAVPGDPNWNAMYDFDRSFKIDGADFNLVLTKFNLKGDLYYY